ncbi:hypoxanthine phosphoribosyltransferase [bacterium]|nr:hypoxanthine phosphoribosyltransferase [bacterium]
MYEIIMSELQVKSVVERLASEVAADCAGKPLVVTGILKACVHFMSDLLRALSERGVEAEIDFIECASYSGTESTGKVECLLPPQIDCRGKYVLLVDTVLESGRTLKKAFEIYSSLGPAQIEACVLLDKDKCRKEKIEAKFVGLSAGNDFIVGYGADYNQKYRNLPFVAKLVKEEK